MTMRDRRQTRVSFFSFSTRRVGNLFQPSRRSTIAPPEHCRVSYVIIATAAATAT
jgi:hypothetical protein